MIKKIFESSRQKGAVSKTLIIAVVAVILVIIIIFIVVRFTSVNKSESSKTGNPPANGQPEPPKPVYETTLGDVRFSLGSADDLGNIIKSNLSYQNDLTTTEKFIRVVIGAQNKGKANLPQYSWDIGNIVDSEGRNFVSINDKAFYLLPRPDLCGALLKPEFAPVPCVKYYEVSKISKGLKLVIRVTQPKKEESMLDLYFNQ
mgnify:CR=1 FL=1